MTLDRIKVLYRKPRQGERRSLKNIADALNTEGRATRTGKPWSREACGLSCKECD